MDLAGLHHVALSVRDLDRSSSWYQEVLGLVEEVRLDAQDRRSAILRVPNTAQQVGLVEHHGPNGAFRAQNLGLDHVAFAVATRDGLDDWASWLAREGVDASGVIETPFGGMLHFSDPDGIALAMFWNR